MYHENIKEITKNNTNFREVLYTGKASQLVVMSLKVGEEIGEEVHESIDQLIFIVEGDAEATVNNERFGIEEHDVLFIQAGTKHNVKNIGDEELKLYTIYAPAEHPENTVQATKADALE